MRDLTDPTQIMNLEENVDQKEQYITTQKLANDYINAHIVLAKYNKELNDLQEPPRPEAFLKIGLYDAYQVKLIWYKERLAYLKQQRNELSEHIRSLESQIFKRFYEAGRFLYLPLSDINDFLPLERNDGLKLLEIIEATTFTGTPAPFEFIIRNKARIDVQIKWKLYPADASGIKLTNIEFKN